MIYYTVDLVCDCGCGKSIKAYRSYNTPSQSRLEDGRANARLAGWIATSKLTLAPTCKRKLVRMVNEQHSKG